MLFSFHISIICFPPTLRMSFYRIYTPATEGVQRHCGFGLNMAGGSLNNEAYKTNNIFTEVLKFFLKMAGILKKVMHVSATLLK